MADSDTDPLPEITIRIGPDKDKGRFSGPYLDMSATISASDGTLYGLQNVAGREVTTSKLSTEIVILDWLESAVSSMRDLFGHTEISRSYAAGMMPPGDYARYYEAVQERAKTKVQIRIEK